MIELPPLPEPRHGELPYYFDADMRAYGEACARAALEAAAAACLDEQVALDVAIPVSEDKAYNCATEHCAKAIRALIAPSSPSSSQTRS